MPDSTETRFSNLSTQADILYEAGRFEESIAYAMRAITLLPNEPRPYAQVAYALARQEKPESAEWARKAIAKDPRNPSGDTHSGGHSPYEGNMEKEKLPYAKLSQ